MPKAGRPYSNPKLGKMTKHVSIWMHESLWKQQVSEAKSAKIGEGDLMRVKLAKKHTKKASR